METLVEKKKYTYEEYLQLEKQTDARYEFWNGEIFAMAGGTKNHNEIAGNIHFYLRDNFRPKGCRIFAEGVKLELQKNQYYVYPDVLLTCDPTDNDEYFVTSPTLLVEVLSPGTEAYDRSVKLAQYRKIKSLRYYLLVSQSLPFVEIFARTNENELFTYDVAEGMEAIIQMPALNFALSLGKIYEYIEFQSL